MPGGMPAKPTAELKLMGNYDKRRHANRADETLAIGMPRKPEGMSAQEAWLWDTVVDTMPAAALSSLDTATLIGLCWWWGEWRRLTAAIEDGGCDAYRASCMAASAWKQFSGMASKFGMSPVDRTKIQLPNNGGGDEFDAFLETA